MGIILALLIGAVAGWLAGKLVSGGGFGLVGNVVVGVVGAVIARWILPQLGFGMGGGVIAQTLHATLGAVVLLVLIRLDKRV